MPKLLDVVKESGLSHEEVVELIKNRDVKPDGEEEEEIEEVEEIEEDDKPDDEDDVKALIQKLADEEEAKIEIKEKAEKVKIALMVQEELKRRGKIDRKTPSKGKITDVPKLEYEINTKGYEVKTIRKTV